MSVYTTVPGDTFALISRKVYGVETESSRIQQANPGLAEPLLAGLVIHTPPQIDIPLDQIQQNAEESPNKVALFIANKKFTEWSEITINQSIDAVSTVDFTSVFDINNLESIKTFKPFSYYDIHVSIGSDNIFSGTMLDPVPQINDESSTIDVNAYSLPGVLQDCPVPASAYPLEFNNVGLVDIAKKLTDPFGLSVEFKDEPGAIFERVSTSPQTPVLNFLIKLAKQRNLLISTDVDGKLIFQKSVTPGNPVARLTEGSSPLVSIKPKFNAQEYFSHISALEPVSVGLEGSQFTVTNSKFDLSRIRPFVFSVPDTQNPDLEVAANSKMGRMLANAVSYEIELLGWRNEQDFNSIWQPNTTLTVFAPSAFIFEDYEFTIRDVTLVKTADSEFTLLDVVLPGAFRGELPEFFPWEL